VFIHVRDVSSSCNKQRLGESVVGARGGAGSRTRRSDSRSRFVSNYYLNVNYTWRRAGATVA
jgi:hypothetical protein